MRKGLLYFSVLIIFLVSLVSADVFINEFVVDPKTDWDGSGTAGSADEWIELFNDGSEEVDLTGWILNLIDGTDEVEMLDGIIPANGFLVVLNPAGQQNNNGRIVLSNALEEEIDSVSYGSFDDGNTDDNAPDGKANDVSDECVARISDGMDTDVDSDDFVKTQCTFNSSNIEEEPECIFDSDCGEDSISAPLCMEGDVRQTETIYSCVEGMCIVNEEEELIEECEFGCENGECLTLLEELMILSPVQDMVYGERNILLDILHGSEAESIRYNDNNHGFKRLCSWCDSYTQTKQFTDGKHELIVKALDDDGEAMKIVDFVVDTKWPNIKHTFPVAGFTSGMFFVEFKELNPESLRLNYGQEGDINVEEIDLDGCFERGVYTDCEVKVDVAEFDGEQIMYWFALEDILGRAVESNIEKVWIDSTSPVINSFSYEVIGRSLRIMIDITEENFASVQYIDHDEMSPRYRTLCYKLNDGECDVRKFFSRGSHEIDIRVLDKAGNEVMVIDGLAFG